MTDEVVNMPVFRPCIGMDKDEIVDPCASDRDVRDVCSALRQDFAVGVYAPAPENASRT